MVPRNIQRIFWYHHKIAQQALHKDFSSPSKWLTTFFLSFRQDDYSDSSDERAFVRFYLLSTKDFCIRFLLSNIVLLLVSVYVIAQKSFGHKHTDLDPTFDAYQPAIVEISIWMILSALCLGYFLTLHYRPSLFKELRFADDCDIWYEIGATVMFARFLMLVAQLVTMVNTGEKCLDAPDLLSTVDTTFGYMFIKMAVDAYQTFAFAALPFLQPWAVVFVIIDMIKQLIRLYSCADRITMDPQLRWIILLVALLIVIAYMLQIILPSLFLEGSYRNRYKSMQMQRQAEASKQEMVTFLCTDVRVPLQYMLHALDSIDLVSISGSVVQPLLADIHEYSHVVNDIADDLLLLVRIKENRYTSKLVLVPNLQQLFDNVVQSMQHRGKQHSTEGNGETRSPECVVTASAPTTAATVNKECLVAALRHLLIFICSFKSQGEARDTSVVAPGLEVNITVRIAAGTPSSEVSSKETLAVTVVSNSLNQRRWSEEIEVQEATTAYVCNAIAISGGGTFICRDNKYEMTLPCKTPRSSDDVARASSLLVVDNSVPSVLVGGEAPPASAQIAPAHGDDAESTARTAAPTQIQADNRELELKIKLTADMQARFKKNRVCVIIEDTVLEDVIIAAIKRMHLDEGMAVLHELQKGTMPIAKLTFVTSFRLCQELRARRYQGLIVLFSGSLSYLDDAQLSMLDYCLQLPCTDLHLSAFIDWLVSVYNEEIKQAAAMTSGDGAPASPSSRAALRKRRHRRVIGSRAPAAAVAVDPRNADTGVAEAAQIGPVLFIITVCKLARSVFTAWQAQDTWFLVPALPQGTYESYTKWKLLNPSGSWYHHSTEMSTTVLLRLLMCLFLETLAFQQNPSSILPVSVVCVIMICRTGVYKYVLEKRNIPLYAYWLIPTAIVNGYYIASVISGSVGQSSDDRNLTLSEYTEHVFADGRTGAQYLYGQIMTVTYARPYSIYFAQPLNLTILLLILLRATQAVWQVLRTFCSVQVCSFLQLVYVQMTVLNIQYVIHLETSYRNEFMVAHQHILDKAFLDQCLDICQQDIRKPLELLLARQDDLVKVIMRSAYIRSVHLTRALVCKLEPLHVSTLLIMGMVHAFTYHNQAVMADDVALVRSSLDSIQLGRSVAKIIAGFSSYAENFHIKIYSEIDNKLAVIRVDWRMLSMILTNLLNTALKNVRDYCIETPRNKDLMNHILLKFTAIDSDAKLPFVHPRLMLINVCDSSNVAAKSAIKSAATMSISEAPSVSMHSGAATSAADLAEQSDRVSSKYGNTVCEKLVHKVSLKPLFETVATDSQFQTVQRFTFNYHLTPQTRKAQEFIEAEADKNFLTVMVCPSNYLSAYERIVLQPKESIDAGNSVLHRPLPGAKRVLYLSGVEPEQRKETIKLTKRFDSHGWSCAVKYILKVPSMYTIDNADCVLIDQQLELLHNVNISDTVLKLRVCGFNGLIAVLLQEGARLTDVIKEELSRSAAEIDVLLFGPLKDRDIQALTVALEKKYIKQLLYMNGN